MTLDREFYVRRIAQEHALSLSASSPEAAAVHRELAAAYRAKLDGKATEIAPDLATVATVKQRQPRIFV